MDVLRWYIDIMVDACEEHKQRALDAADLCRPAAALEHGRDAAYAARMATRACFALKARIDNGE